MAGSKSDSPSNQPASENIQEGTKTYENEVYLIDYLRILWKRKYFVVLGSILPAVVFGLVLFLWPRNYRVTYTYDMGLNEKEYKTLLDKFYSQENLAKVISKLRDNGLNKYARKIAEATTDRLQKKLVHFEVSPSFFETMETLKTADVKDIEEIQQAKGTLLAMIIKGRPKEDMPRISLIIRDNFENMIPMYAVKQRLNSTIISLKTDMAKIEENRYSLELELAKRKAILTKLRRLKPEGSGQMASEVILQFENVGGNSSYLPLAYQIQATESNIINLEESIQANEQRYDYLESLLSLNQKLFDEVKKRASPHYSIQQFHPSLINMASDYQDKELVDYLNAYIKKIENAMSASIPIMEKPRVYQVPKATAKKSSIAFAISLLVTIFAAFLLEAIGKGQVQAR